MVNPVSTSFHDQSATLRQLKLLVVLLVFSNVGLGIFGFFLLRKIDHRYSELIDHSVPVLSDLQELTVKSLQAMRSTNPELFANASAPRARWLQAAEKALDQDRTQRTTLLGSEWIAGGQTERANLTEAGTQFTQSARQVVAQLAAGNIPEATRLREEALRPAFDRYLLAATKAAELLESESRRANNDVSARTSSLSTVLLSVASWPVVLLAGLLLLTAVFVVVLMILFRGREMSDMP